MCSSSSVPTTRSQSARISCRCRVTCSERDIALLARAMPGEAPEIGPVVDVEHHLARPFARAMRIAFFCAAAEFSREKCVPVTTIAPAEPTNASSMSLSSSAASAQSVR